MIIARDGIGGVEARWYEQGGQGDLMAETMLPNAHRQGIEGSRSSAAELVQVDLGGHVVEVDLQMRVGRRKQEVKCLPHHEQLLHVDVVGAFGREPAAVQEASVNSYWAGGGGIT